MKKFIYSLAAILALLGCVYPASAEYKITYTPKAECPPRYFFSPIHTSYDFIFTGIIPFHYYIDKFNIPFETKFSDSKLFDYAIMKVNADSSVFTFAFEKNNNPVYIVTNGRTKEIAKTDVSKFFGDSILNTTIQYWLTPTIIDTTQILLRLQLTPASYVFKYASKGNMLVYNPSTDAFSIPKVYFPEFKDSANAYFPTNLGKLPPDDPMKPLENGKIIVRLCNYEFSKALDAGDTSIILNETPQYVYAVYDPAVRSFKAISSYNTLRRNAAGATVENSYPGNLEGNAKNNYFWISSYYDDFYNRNFDTLNIYNSETDAVRQYYLFDTLTYYRSTVYYSKAGNDGTVILLNTNNICYIIRPDGNLTAENRFATFFSDSSTTQAKFAGDREGNIYSIYHGSSYLYKLSPDGVLTEMSLGQLCNDPYTYVNYYLANSYFYLDIYEDATSKFLAAAISSGITRDTTNLHNEFMIYDFKNNGSLVEGSQDFTQLYLDNICPNPASGIIDISISSDNNTMNISSLKIYTETGALAADLSSLLSLASGRQTVSFDSSTLPSGSYIIAAANPLCRVSRKFVVK